MQVGLKRRGFCEDPKNSGVQSYDLQALESWNLATSDDGRRRHYSCESISSGVLLKIPTVAMGVIRSKAHTQTIIEGSLSL